LSHSVIALVGPTASGKTEVAFELSKLLPLEVISCDSMQVYRKMPILTQAPSVEFLKSVKTHLLAHRDPSEEYNAALFRKEASASIEQILKRKKTPLIVGGAGLYLRVLLDGLFEMVEENTSNKEGLRQKLLEEEKNEGMGTLHKKLEAMDPASAKKIHRNDVRRIIRALEVCALTGKTFSEQKLMRKGIREEFDVKIFFLERDRKDLYERINHRVDTMFEQGVVDEVKGFLKVNLSKTAQAALGISEIRDHLEGKTSLEEAKELVQTLSKDERLDAIEMEKQDEW